MGIGGRKPTTDEQKVIYGTFRKDRANPDAPQPEKKIPSAPDFLTFGAKAEWRRVTKELLASGIISPLERGLLAAYCQCYDRWKRAEKKTREEGEYCVTPNGFPQVAPWVTLAKQCEEEIRKLSCELGLTWSSRQRMKTGEQGVKKKDKKERFFK